MRRHLARRGDRYYAVVYEGIDPATGKERHRWYPAGTTRKAAEKVLGDLVKRVHDGDYRSPERITLGDYLLERWLPTKQSQLRPSTFASYRNNVETHINPRIGHIALQKLQPEDRDTFYAQLLVDGRRNGKGGGLAPKTVRIIHGIMRKALADAMRKGTVTRNVADLADPPKVQMLRLFQRTTVVNEYGLQQRFRQDLKVVGSEVIPQLERHGILEPRKWHGGGTSEVWALVVPLDELLASEEPGTVGTFSEFWRDVKSA